MKKVSLDSFEVPFIECVLLGVALEASFLNEKFHALVERGGDGRRLLPQQDVDGLRGCDAKW